jgi:hypothetical protein
MPGIDGGTGACMIANRQDLRVPSSSPFPSSLLSLRSTQLSGAHWTLARVTSSPRKQVFEQLYSFGFRVGIENRENIALEVGNGAMPP